MISFHQKQACYRYVQPVPSRPGSGPRVRPSVLSPPSSVRVTALHDPRHRAVLGHVPTRVEPVFPTRVANPGSPLNRGVLYVRH